MVAVEAAGVVLVVVVVVVSASFSMWDVLPIGLTRYP